jgi:hypothetical protein
VLIVSPEFAGKTTLAKHRLVLERLQQEILELHAFVQVSFTFFMTVHTTYPRGFITDFHVRLLPVSLSTQRTFTPEQYANLKENEQLEIKSTFKTQ